MSRENVEVVRRNAEAFGRNDWEAVLADAPEDVEWVIAEEHPNARTLRGRKEVAAYLRDWGETLSELRFDFYELSMLAVPSSVWARSPGGWEKGGPEVTVELATVTDFRDGVPVRTREFLDSKAALEAAGLRE